ncbi:MAG: 1-deoxy-D-xylulose-5-phosphate reductoisomerase [Treponema sp.]|nr:1-deoxy-D-xylulose-5-phosphate reductoisomerase [Treponema sp.]
MKKRVAILGATGSIGTSAIDIVSRNDKDFEVVLFTAYTNQQKLNDLQNRFPKALCLLSAPDNSNICEAIKNVNAGITINAISGAAGLLPSAAAIEAGSNLALANKETIVLAGKLILNLAKKNNVNIIPVDSEHSAVFHLLRYFGHEGQGELISEIVLTASGGPFRNFSAEEMKNVTVNDALSHPTWNMGKKITIDSATMANKGLEIIEAHGLFDLPPEKIKVVIHPQSIVHSMIRLCNGVFYAQLSKPDMRHPIHDALYWPQPSQSNLEPLNFDSLTLEFSKPDTKKFPMLALAWEAAKMGGLYPCVYNAANEIAVEAFLNNKIAFLDIPKITEKVFESDWSGGCDNFEVILNADKKARVKAGSFIK